MFRQRISGAYFAILSQALAAAFVIVIVGNPLTGGTNGLTNFQHVLRASVIDTGDQRILYFIVVDRRCCSSSSRRASSCSGATGGC